MTFTGEGKKIGFTHLKLQHICHSAISKTKDTIAIER
ncbi:hypothetical protein HNP76_000384 [Treponema ruminis]|uniref:Uncharacterized protein n=1 Tax=Treponema ruminis TaxID=744515 RepID=A0A7W8G7A2_9SPIR|nr:hypothetical protein [Treponema ruminis]